MDMGGYNGYTWLYLVMDSYVYLVMPGLTWLCLASAKLLDASTGSLATAYFICTSVN